MIGWPLHTAYHHEIVANLQTRALMDEVRRVEAHPEEIEERETFTQALEPHKLTWRERMGVWAWVLLLGPAVAYEILTAADSNPQTWTLSQVVKYLRRAAGRAGAISLTLMIFGSAITLFLHWVLEVV